MSSFSYHPGSWGRCRPWEGFSQFGSCYVSGFGTLTYQCHLERRVLSAQSLAPFCHQTQRPAFLLFLYPGKKIQDANPQPPSHFLSGDTLTSRPAIRSIVFRTHDLDRAKRQQLRRSPEHEGTEPTGWALRAGGSARTAPPWYEEGWAPALPPPPHHVRTPGQGLGSTLTAQGPQGAPSTITSLVHLS